MDKRSVCFTGHRNVRSAPVLMKRLREILVYLIHNGAAEFYAGGALGWDTICAQSVIELRRSFPHIRLNLVLPCPPEEQTVKWNDMQKEVYYAVLSAADSVEIISEQYEPTCMKKRNARLVEYADCCVCYYTNRTASGTGQTVRMAQKKQIEIYNLAGNRDSLL